MTASATAPSIGIVIGFLNVPSPLPSMITTCPPSVVVLMRTRSARPSLLISATVTNDVFVAASIIDRWQKSIARYRGYGLFQDQRRARHIVVVSREVRSERTHTRREQASGERHLAEKDRVVPRIVLPSKNVTMPLANVETPDTLALSVTEWP